jgi:hypothetical protein
LFTRAASVSSRASGMRSIGLLSAATSSSPRVPGNAFEGRAHAVEHHLWCATPLEVACRGLLPRPAGLSRTTSVGEHRRARPGYGRTTSALTHLSPARNVSPKRDACARHARSGYEEAHDTLLSAPREEQSSSGPHSAGVIAHTTCTPSTRVPALLLRSGRLLRRTLSGPPWEQDNGVTRCLAPASAKGLTHDATNQKSANDESKRALAEDDDAPGSAGRDRTTDSSGPHAIASRETRAVFAVTRLPERGWGPASSDK